ncbi:response regulator transcription factor [Paenibacillus doosanensis]|uniref:Transcriptional regulatory protein BaeR n=1 Tax=Paenibacillus konkukensis TaxID=2020716 RepID=A0ABY4RLD0_9BACL|nr:MULTISPECIES: response regulator transcription factor [Paenibacillus]MCS7462199.1 response regulator transcription factor [Paenibacillus doosanensis]UQZ82938.1 Transcriptional regulatory protein BaeR [Paenibacillus konkukensis]
MHKVFIIEDDTIIGDMLSMYLSEEGYAVQRTESGREALAILEHYNPDIVLLDIVLPDVSGIQLCGELRKRSTVPILVISMKTDVMDRVNALHAGADDYLCKPFSMRELSAKIAAMIRRTYYNRQMRALEPENVPAVSRIFLNFDKRSLYVNGQQVDTTFSEFEIMKLFIANPGKVYSREELINAVRGFDSFVNDRAIDVHIGNLRKKIEEDSKQPKYIKTVWGVGYKFMNI